MGWLDDVPGQSQHWILSPCFFLANPQNKMESWTFHVDGQAKTTESLHSLLPNPHLLPPTTPQLPLLVLTVMWGGADLRWFSGKTLPGREIHHTGVLDSSGLQGPCCQQAVTSTCSRGLLTSTSFVSTLAVIWKALSLSQSFCETSHIRRSCWSKSKSPFFQFSSVQLLRCVQLFATP